MMCGAGGVAPTTATAGFHGPMAIADIVAECGANSVPERVKAFVKEYWLCKNDMCKQIYWVGPKYEDASEKFRKLFPK